MRKSVLFLGISLLFSCTIFVQVKPGKVDASKVPVPRWHYLPEYIFDKPTDPVSWMKQKTGMFHLILKNCNKGKQRGLQSYIMLIDWKTSL